MEQFRMDTYLESLEYLVNFDNGSYTPEGTVKVAEFFQQKFAANGWKTCLHKLPTEKVGPCLQITNCEDNDYDVLLLGHMDSVFPAGEAAKRPYHINEQGIVTGVGVSDMKGCLLAAYYALVELKNEDKLGKGKICFLLNSDEETGSMYSRELIERVAVNAKHVLVIEAARKNGDMVKARSGVADFDLQAEGVAAHAGVAPQDGSSAIHELANWVIALHKLSDYEAGTSVNVGTIKGGTARNVVADTAFAEVDVRFRQESELQRIQSAFAGLSNKSFTPGGAQVKYSFRLNRPPMNASQQTEELCEAVSGFGREMGIHFNWVATGGGSDGNYTAAMGIPTIDGVGPVGGGGHSVKEWLDTKTVEPRLRLLQKMILYCIDR